MIAKEVIEIVKESELWATLTEEEKPEVIKHALRSAHLSITDGDMGTTVGEVYLEREWVHCFTECEFQGGKLES